MPGPPPKGASSTERCLSRAKPRMSTVSSRQSPSWSALPASERPTGPGNISGKIVRTVASQVAMSDPALFGDIRLDRPIVEEALGRVDDQTAGGEIDLRHDRAGEGHHDSAAILARHVERIAGAEIMDGADGS